jgi:archaellum biogenesis ATPase FlaH
MLDRSSVARAFAQVGIGEAPEPRTDDWQAPTEIPECADGEPIVDMDPPSERMPTYVAITSASWKGTEAKQQRCLARGRIPCGDLTIGAGNGGSGKTEIFTQLLIYVAAGLADWLGCTIENGVALFLSCEESEDNIRERVERITKHRSIDLYNLPNLHMVFPDLESTWLVHASKDGRLSRAPLLAWLEDWITEHRPRLVVIDSIAAVFDGDAINRRQVRAFLAMLRKIARDHDVAIVLLDHPSVRGMADGTGTANSVDWRNSVRSMLHLSDPEKDDQDVRMLSVTKSNYSRRRRAHRPFRPVRCLAPCSVLPCDPGRRSDRAASGRVRQLHARQRRGTERPRRPSRW